MSGAPGGPRPARFELGWVLPVATWRTTPGRVAFVAAVLATLVWSILALAGVRGSSGVALYLLAELSLSLAVAHLLATHGRGLEVRPLGPGTYFVLIAGLALAEETLAYAVGGGLDGHATSLLEDWARSVPVFLGLAAGLAYAQYRYGPTPAELFGVAAVAGVAIEVVLGREFSPVSAVLTASAAAWIYGSILAWPGAFARAQGTSPRPLWATAGVTALGFVLGAVVGLVL